MLSSLRQHGVEVENESAKLARRVEQSDKIQLIDLFTPYFTTDALLPQPTADA